VVADTLGMTNFVDINNQLAKTVARLLLKEHLTPDIGLLIDRTMQPCRVEMIDSRTYLDVCHNISGVQAVMQYLKLKHSRINVVCGFSKLKDTRSILEHLVKEAN